MKIKLFKNFIVVISIFFFLGCTSVKKVNFETPVDTTSKRILLQDKKIFKLNDIGVFASNDFDGARLNDFVKLNDSTIQIVIKPENSPINNSAYYAFKIWSNNDKKVYLEFNYPEGYKHRYTPKLKTSNGKWKILEETKIIKRSNQFKVELNISSDTTTISAQELVTSNATYKWVKEITNNKPHVHTSIAGLSNLGKDIPVLDIYNGNKKDKPIIILLTRQHPPEVTGFFAFQEFLKTLLRESSLTTNFFNNYRVLAFPIVNPDGVDLGHWRHNANGVDTNRDWSIYNQKEIKQIVKFITKASKNSKGRVILGLDFHSTYEDVFYTNKLRKNTTLPTFIDDWFSALEANISNYKVNEKAGNSTKPVSKGWFLYGHNAVGITYEIGDATPKDKIKHIGMVSAEQMMKILNKENNN